MKTFSAENAIVCCGKYTYRRDRNGDLYCHICNKYWRPPQMENSDMGFFDPDAMPDMGSKELLEFMKGGPIDSPKKVAQFALATLRCCRDEVPKQWDFTMKSDMGYMICALLDYLKRAEKGE